AENNQVRQVRLHDRALAALVLRLKLSGQLGFNFVQRDWPGFRDAAVGRFLRHMVLQWRPSTSMIRSASRGPHVPALYPGRKRSWLRSQVSRMGMTKLHAASTASRRMNKVASPAITSKSSRSYASGVVPP